jgi:lysyl-tRNA synthetase class 2
MDKIIGHFIEPECLQPTFLMNHPLIMSPLAKEHRSRPGISERFELFVSGMELCNAYTELNNPHEQKRRFFAQMEDKKNGDAEAQEIDYSFIDALEIGMPCCGGFGMGLERLIMILCNERNIREVLAFPQHRNC